MVLLQVGDFSHHRTLGQHSQDSVGMKSRPGARAAPTPVRPFPRTSEPSAHRHERAFDPGDVSTGSGGTRAVNAVLVVHPTDESQPTIRLSPAFWWQISEPRVETPPAQGPAVPAKSITLSAMTRQVRGR